MNRKKLIIISSVIVILIAIIVGVYFGLQSVSDVISPTPSPSGFPTSPTGGVNQDNGDGALYKDGNTFSENYTQEEYATQKSNLSILSERETTLFWVYEGDETETFFISEDIVYVVSDEGESVVGKLPRTGPYTVTQNVDGSFALISFEYGSALFDSQKRAWNILPFSFYSAAFSPNGEVIVFSRESDGKTQIVTVNIDNLEKTTLHAQMYAHNLLVDWLSSSAIVVTTPSSYEYESTAWSININTNRVEKMFSGNGLRLITSPEDNFIARFVSETPLTIRADVFSITGSRSPFTLPFSTLASKCSFYTGEASLVCGIPYVLNKQSGVRLPDSYLQRDVYTKDEIYHMTFDGSLVSRLVFGAREISLDVSHPVSIDNSFYFINRLDSKLYRLDLSHE